MVRINNPNLVEHSMVKCDFNASIHPFIQVRVSGFLIKVKFFSSNEKKHSEAVFKLEPSPGKAIESA